MNDAYTMLEQAKTIAIVGLSSNPMRPSYDIGEYLQSQGYRIIPVNPKEQEVLGERCYPTLEAVPEKVDVVNVFRRAEFTPPVVDSAIAIGAKGVWLQLGIRNEEAEAKAKAAGLWFVQDSCILVVHRIWRHKR